MSDEYVGDLGALKPAPGSTKKTKRIGRGRGSGHGDTATRGHKGAKSRSGYKVKPGFEGGQMPLKRRIPKRGFTSMNKTPYQEVNVGDLSRLPGEQADPETMRQARLVKGRGPIVILGDGAVDRALSIKAHRVTGSAEEKIKAAGGAIEILPLDPIDRKVKKGPKVKNKAGQGKGKKRP